MKFESQEEKDLLNRLTLNPDFQHYVRKLGDDYKKALHEHLLAPPDNAEWRRGQVAQLHLLLKALGAPK